MNDSRYRRLLAELDDVRCTAQELLDELPSTDIHALPLRRVVRHCSSDIKLLQAGGRLPA